MARRKKKAGRARTRRASYRVRRNPRASTKGGRRVSARRAYMKTAAPVRRRARRNPKGPLSSPAVQYGLATAAGFAAASYADTWDMLNPKKQDGTAALPWGLKGSALAAAITLAVAQFGLKGKNRSYGYAVGIGLLAPSAINMIQTAVATNTAGGARAGGYNYLPPRGKVHRLATSAQAAKNFSRASQALDNCA